MDKFITIIEQRIFKQLKQIKALVEKNLVALQL